MTLRQMQVSLSGCFAQSKKTHVKTVIQRMIIVSSTINYHYDGNLF
jgi:hypothetical protein